MSKLGNAIRILAVPCMLIGFAAGADAATSKAAKPASVVKMASGSETSAPASVAISPVIQASVPVASVPVASVPACARKVKVVYAGYGEADRAGCSVASAETAP